MVIGFLLLYAVGLLIVLAWGFGYLHDYEETWDSSPESIADLRDGQYVQLHGTINSTEGAVLFREDPADPDSEIISIDFLLRQEQEDGSHLEILVNLSYLSGWSIRNDTVQKPDPYYTDGDEVYILGYVWAENSTLNLDAEYMMDNDAREGVDDILNFLWIVVFVLTPIILLTLNQVFLPLYPKWVKNSTIFRFIVSLFPFGNDHEARSGGVLFRELWERTSPRVIENPFISRTKVYLFLLCIMLIGLVFIWIRLVDLWSFSEYPKLDVLASVIPVIYLMTMAGHGLIFIPVLYAIGYHYRMIISTFRKIELDSQGMILYMGNREPYAIRWDDIDRFHVLPKRLVFRALGNEYGSDLPKNMAIEMKNAVDKLDITPASDVELLTWLYGRHILHVIDVDPTKDHLLFSNQYFNMNFKIPWDHIKWLIPEGRNLVLFVSLQAISEEDDKLNKKAEASTPLETAPPFTRAENEKLSDSYVRMEFEVGKKPAQKVKDYFSEIEAIRDLVPNPEGNPDKGIPESTEE